MLRLEVSSFSLNFLKETKFYTLDSVFRYQELDTSFYWGKFQNFLFSFIYHNKILNIIFFLIIYRILIKHYI